MDNLFNVNQAAFILKVHPLTIRRYIKEGKLKAIKIAGSVRIREADLQNLPKEFSTAPKVAGSQPKEKAMRAKTFTSDDPIFRLKGRGATLHLSE